MIAHIIIWAIVFILCATVYFCFKLDKVNGDIDYTEVIKSTREYLKDESSPDLIILGSAVKISCDVFIKAGLILSVLVEFFRYVL